MLDQAIKIILIFLLIFTPIAIGSMEVWAFSVMELGILLIIILWAIQTAIGNRQLAIGNPQSSVCNHASKPPRINTSTHSRIHLMIVVLLSLFLLLVLFQLLPLPAGIVKMISPKTFALRHSLTIDPVRSFLLPLKVESARQKHYESSYSRYPIRGCRRIPLRDV
jgi:hypothetical protein